MSAIARYSGIQSLKSVRFSSVGYPIAEPSAVPLALVWCSLCAHFCTIAYPQPFPIKCICSVEIDIFPIAILILVGLTIRWRTQELQSKKLLYKKVAFSSESITGNAEKTDRETPIVNVVYEYRTT